MVNAIQKISDSNNNLRKGVDGAIELRSLAPIFFHIPHRDNNVVHNKQQKIKREQLFREKNEDNYGGNYV